MKSVAITDFSGGIQESTSPNDFSNRQWAKLKGIIPKNNTSFESQWAAQSFPTTTIAPGIGEVKLNQVFPLESALGTFLIGIKESGQIVWAKIPPPNVDQATANKIIWRTAVTSNLVVDTLTASVPSYPNGSAVQPRVAQPFSYPDKRFITTLPFEVYKYVKSSFPGRSWDTTQDIIFEEAFTSGKSQPSAPMSVCPGVLIGCRRAYRGNSLGIFTPRIENDWDSVYRIPAAQHSMVVAYVDPLDSAETWSGATYDPATFDGSLVQWQATKQGVIKLVTFPNFRRWPTRTDVSYGKWPEQVVTEPSGNVTYAETQISKLMRVVRSTPGAPTGFTEEFVGVFPQQTYQEQISGIKQAEFFHPYTYKDSAQTLLPGRGIIPRANVGTIWNGQLILGDIEWRSDKAATADSQGKAIVPASAAFLGALTDNNTQPHRGSIYYGEDDIDVFDPRSVLRATSSDARIAGLHVIDNRLICITTASSELDGVVSFSGNLGQLHPYGEGASPNPYAVRKQLVRGGVGVADHLDDGSSYSRQTCLWSEAGIVVFVDRLGGVFYTDGQACDRLDRYGPKQPNSSTYKDIVAAVGKHLFVWRDGRLLAFSIVDSSNSAAQGCWTEVVAPSAAYTSDRGIYSMVGGTSQLFMLVEGQVFRYAPDSPMKGTIQEVPVDIEVATQTIGDLENHKKTSWHRIGFSFYTPTTCSLTQATVKGEAFLHENAPGETTVVPTYTVNPANNYETGHFDFVAPAGIGPQFTMSSYFKFQGDIVLKGFTAWASSEIPSRIEP
jgi:hypothetical protein